MRLDYDVIVVGGGPAGCAVARDVAAAGFRVLVAEEHQQIGEPLQCAGLISERALALSGVTDGVVLHRLTGARVHAPGGQLLDLQGERVYALAVDRVRFDRELALQAEKSGAEVHTGARVADIELVPGGVRVNIIYRSELRPGVVEISGAKRLTCRLLVGADGHKSLVRRWMNLPEPQEKVPLFAAEVELYLGIEKAVAGNRIGDISSAIQNYVESEGYHVVRDFVGHGIGRNMHEEPQVPNYGKPGHGLRLQAGLVLAIEPMVNIGTHEVIVMPDRWTVVTKDGSLSAHFEHTVAVTEGQPEILTRL